MFKPISLEPQHVLKEKIEQQKTSGQPIAQWCQENDITIGRFYYWRDKFFPKKIQRSEFVELKSSQKTGIRVESNGVFIDLEPHFDSITLKKCLILLRELSC